LADLGSLKMVCTIAVCFSGCLLLPADIRSHYFTQGSLKTTPHALTALNFVSGCRNKVSL